MIKQPDKLNSILKLSVVFGLSSILFLSLASGLTLPREYLDLLRRNGYKMEETVLRVVEAKKGCAPSYNGGVQALINSELFHKTGIMGDGKGGFLEDDNRVFPGPDDMAANATGTIWCADSVGVLQLAGSGNLNRDEVTCDVNSGRFIYKPWKSANDVVSTNSHVVYERIVKNSGKVKSYPFDGSCYFYPRGNEPARNDVIAEDGVFKYPPSSHRTNESALRHRVMTMVAKSSDPHNLSNSKAGDDWAALLLEGYPSSKFASVPVLNCSQEEINKIIKNYPNKYYGFNLSKWEIRVSKENCTAEANERGSLLGGATNISYDECDSNGKGSGGQRTVALPVEGFGVVEVQIGIRRSHAYKSGKPKPVGEKFDIYNNANVTVHINSEFYSALKRLATSTSL